MNILENKLYKRTVLDKILPYLNTRDVIVIQGARQTGKTSLLKLLISCLKDETHFFMDLEDSRYLDICEEGCASVLEYLKLKGISTDKRLFLFIDEIQYLSNPSSFLKIMHDHYGQVKLIVSGSSSFEIRSKFKDSLVGRTVTFELFPLSFEEFLIFKEKKYNLKEAGSSSVLSKELSRLYSEYALFGDYPKIVLADSGEKKEAYLQQIIDTYIKKDIRDLAKIRDIVKFNKFISALSAQSGQLININELSGTTGLARKTIEHYLFILENTYIIKLLFPYSRNIRSELYKTPKIFFYDTGLLHLLHLKMIPTVLTGHAFETSVFSEFIKNTKRDTLFYWRTQDKKEIDFIYTGSGKAIPFEVKLNAASLKATALNYFREKYNTASSYCVRMEGQADQKNKYVDYIYPWEIKRVTTV